MVRCLVYENDEEDLPIMKLEIKKVDSQYSLMAPPAIVAEEEDSNSQEITTTSDSEMQEEENLVFKDKDSMLEYLKNNLTVDEIYQKFGENGDEPNQMVCKVVATVPFNQILTEYLKGDDNMTTSIPEQSVLVSTMVTELSQIMGSNHTIKCKVLDQLSRANQQDFLEQSLQVNSPNTVCDKLSAKTIANYLTSSMNKELVLQLISSTNSMVENQSEYQEILGMLFKDIEKVKVFDIVHEFLRKLL